MVGFRISLLRQKTAREHMLNSPDLEAHGIYTKWLGEGKNDTLALKRFLDVSKENTKLLKHNLF